MLGASRSLREPSTLVPLSIVALSARVSESDWLDRHEGRREAGLPTFSVLCDEPFRALETARKWAEASGRPIVPVHNPEPEHMVEAWVDAHVASRDLTSEAVAWLARRMGRPEAELAAQIGRMTPLELTLFLDSARLPNERANVRAHTLLAGLGPGKGMDSGTLARRLLQVAQEHEGEATEQLLTALGDSPGGRGRPILLLAPPLEAERPSAWLETVANGVERMTRVLPGLTAIVAIALADLEAYLRDAPESRAKALLQAGIIPTRTLTAPDIERRLDAAIPGASASLRRSLRRLVSDGATQELLELFVTAARETLGPAAATEVGTDRARSAAERFLFARLESLPQTFGWFELNGKLDVPFGSSRNMEIDLMARRLNLAIEIDGYYHFREADNYRRDRRKDLLLQQHGYLIIRVLAEDVVARLEEVLNTITEVIEACGQSGTRRKGQAP